MLFKKLSKLHVTVGNDYGLLISSCLHFVPSNLSIKILLVLFAPMTPQFQWFFWSIGNELFWQVAHNKQDFGFPLPGLVKFTLEPTPPSWLSTFNPSKIDTSQN